MLVLTRKSDERILIGKGIELVVLSVQGFRVRLGIQAPVDVAVTRTSAHSDLMPGGMASEPTAQELCAAE